MPIFANMKRLLLAAAMLLCAWASYSQEIRSVDIELYINDDGDAYVKQRWDVTVVRGTEWYIPIGNLNGSQIRGLTVEENGVAFIDEGRNWDTDRTLEQKAGRCGIVEKGSDGVELCWGQGSMGDHVWNTGYVILGLVQSLQDYDAFNFMFINPELIARVQHASISIQRLSGEPFKEEDTRFWFFGCDGDSELREDGSVFFETDRTMPRDGKLIVMMCFEKGMFNSANVKNFKFEKMQKKAFKGSSYSKKGNFSFEDLLAYLVGGLFVLGIVGTILGTIFLVIRDTVLKMLGRVWSPKVFGSSKPKGWAREAPFGGSIPVAAQLLKNGSRLALASDHPERSIGAYFMKWIHEGLVTPVKAKGGHYDLEFPRVCPDFEDNCEQNLFLKAMDAAGSNYVLENGEFKSWSTKHFKQLVNWPKSVESAGKEKFNRFKGDKVAEAAKLIQFKNFLSDFTLAKEREVPEVSLWGQYLVFAQLFGIADKVAAGLAKLYPTQFTDYSERYGMDAMMMRNLIHSWSYNTSGAYKAAYSQKVSADAAAAAKAAGGHGGHSSFGGGGGFSGGGFGGGSR